MTKSLIAALLLLAAPPATHASAQMLSPRRAAIVLEPHQTAAGDLILGATLTVHGAGFASLSHLPVGWTASVSSVSSAEAKVDLRCIASCLGINEDAFTNIDLQVDVPDSLPLEQLAVTGTLSVRDTAQRSRTIPLGRWSFSFEEVFSRRRLKP